MPDKRTHRGPHPDDAALFSASTQPLLAHAVADMSWLLSRGYADNSALKLVGDRYNLLLRQRLAVMRCSCGAPQAHQRNARHVSQQALAGQAVVLDGYNILITIEAALAGAVLLIARDGCIRDLASIHGTYRKVSETLPAIETIANALKTLQVRTVTWFLDQPVSNSGRLRQLLLDYAAKADMVWTVELVHNPDRNLMKSDAVAVTSDSIVLDHCRHWFNLARFIIETFPDAGNVNLLDLSASVDEPPLPA